MKVLSKQQWIEKAGKSITDTVSLVSDKLKAANNRFFARQRFVRLIAAFTLLAYVQAFIAHDAVLAVTTLVNGRDAAAEIQNKIEQFVLPYKYGRIVAGNYNGNEKLIVYIQDLHCNPEVQENIHQIIALFDSTYGVKRILVEGAPQGKVDTSLLDAIPEGKIKTNVLRNLLGKGLLSGAEYYAVANKQDKLYGLENWDTYVGNLGVLQRLIASRESYAAAATRLQSDLLSLRQRYLTGKLERLSEYLQTADDTDGAAERRSLLLAKLGESAGESIAEYPNLHRYVQARQLKRQIAFSRLPRALNEYVRELQTVVPLTVNEALKAKQRSRVTDEEYYWLLAEIAHEYSPGLDERYPDVARFLEYVRLNYTVNPSYLLSEENAYIGRVLDKLSGRLIDTEVLFLSKTGSLFAQYVNLRITPEEYAYLRANAARFSVLLKKYLPAADAAEVASLLDDRELARYYETNFRRNDIFAASVAGNDHHESRAAARLPVEEGYSAVLSHLAGFKEIEVVVTGGFHAAIAEQFAARSISSLSILPAVSRVSDDGLYNKVITGALDVRAVSAAALSQPLIQVLGAGYEKTAAGKVVRSYIDILATAIVREAQGEKITPEELNALIDQWRSGTHGEFLSTLTVNKSGPQSWDIAYRGSTTTVELRTDADGTVRVARVTKKETAAAVVPAGEKTRPAYSASEISASAAAFADFRRGVYEALKRYSNVHRGAGQHSQVSTEAFELARHKVLEHLGLNRKDYTVIFVDSRRQERLISLLKPGNDHRAVSLDALGLPFGISALAVRNGTLPDGAPFETGGGTVKLVTPGLSIWDGTPDKFEAGTPNIVGAIALGKALEVIRHFDGNTEIFKARPVNTRETVQSILYQDDLAGLTPVEQLARIKGLLIGRDAEVPVASGRKVFLNLDHGASTPTFEPVWDAVVRVLGASHDVQRQVVAETRRIAAKFFGAPEDVYEHIFAGNTTNAINLVAESFRNRADQETDEDIVVVNTLLEHNSNELPWRSIARGTVLHLAVDDDGFINLPDLRRLLIEYNVEQQHGRQRIRLLAVSGASNVLGSFNDIAAIAREAHLYGAEILVDGAQVSAHRHVNLHEYGNVGITGKAGVDYYAYSGHKVYAPFGSGGLIVRKGLLQLGATAEESARTLAEVKATGEENIVGITALGKALEILDSIGTDTIEKDELDVTKYALERFQALKNKIPGLQVYGVQRPDSENIDRKAGVLVFGISGIPHNLLAKLLAEQSGIGVRSGCFCAHILVQELLSVKFLHLGLILNPLRASFAKFVYKYWPTAKWLDAFKPGLVRVSFGLENTTADVDRLADALEHIAQTRVSFFNRIIGFLRTGTFGKHIPRTTTQAAVEVFVEDSVHDIYSFKHTLSGAINSALRPQKAAGALTEALSPVKTWANSNRQTSSIAAKAGIILALPEEEIRAEVVAYDRASAGLKSIIIKEWRDGPDTFDLVPVGAAIDAIVPAEDGAAHRVSLELFYRKPQGTGSRVLELFVRSDAQGVFAAADTIAGAGVSVVRELNADGVLKKELFGREGFDAEAWLLEDSGSPAFGRAVNFQLVNAEADRSIVYGQWDKSIADPRRSIIDLARQYRASSWRTGKSRRIPAVTATDYTTKIDLWVESASAVPGDGTYDDLIRFGSRSETVNRVITGIGGNGVNILEVNWLRVVNDLHQRGRIGSVLARELTAELRKLAKPEGIVDRQRVAEITEGLVRVAAIALAAQYTGLDSGTITDPGENTTASAKAWRRVQELDGKQLLAVLEQAIDPEDRALLAAYSRHALEARTPDASGEAVQRERYHLELAVQLYVQQQGLAQLARAARLSDKKLLVDLGSGEKSDLLSLAAAWFLKNTSGVRIDLSGTERAAATALIQQWAGLFRDGIASGDLAKDTVVRIKAEQALSGLVRESGFEFEVAADGADEPSIRAAVASGAVLEYDLLRSPDQAKLKHVLTSGASRVAVKIGGLRDGAIVRVRNVDFEKTGLLRLLDLLEKLIPSTELLTAEGRSAAGSRTGKALAERVGLSAQARVLFAVPSGKNTSLIGEAIDATTLSGAKADTAAAARAVDTIINAIELTAAQKEALHEAVASVAQKARGADAAAQTVYTGELRGVLEGVLRHVLTHRNGFTFAAVTTENKRDVIEAYEGLLVRVSRYTGYVDGTIRILPGLDYAKAITALPGLLLALNPQERTDIVRNLLAVTDWRGISGRLNLLALAESLSRSAESDPQGQLLAEVLRKITADTSAVDVRTLGDDELAWWANTENLSKAAFKNRRQRINLGALDELVRRLQSGDPAKDAMLFLALSLSGTGTAALGTSQSRGRSIERYRRAPAALYASRSFWAAQRLTKPEVERRLNAQVNALALFANVAPEKADPESTAITLRILFDQLFTRETVRISQNVPVASLDAVRLVFTAQ